MAGEDADTAARVIERLLVDADFRAEFRRDPAAACRDAGLAELAEEMSYGAGKAMQTLDLRESRSSLAGVMMAAALEGIGVYEFAKHIVPGAAAAPGAARDVLSRVNLPKVDDALQLRGSLAQPPAVSVGAANGAEEAAGSGAAAAPAAIVPAPAPEAAAPASAPAAAVPETAPAAAAPASAGAADPQDGAGAAAAQDDAAAPAQPSSSGPVDPAQFGAEGKGGSPSPETLALLENKNVVLDEVGVADMKAGRIDPRVVAVLTKLSEDHKITVSCMCSDHSKFTSGGSISNHHYGRGLDIAAIDGVPVNASNAMARDIASELSELDPSYRPDEIGTPWAISGAGYFTDAAHQDHLHVAFKQEIDASWKPPAGAAAPEGAAPAAGAAAAATAPDGAASAAASVADGGTLSIAVPQNAAAKAGAGTIGLSIPDAGAAAPPAAGAAPAAAAPPAAGAPTPPPAAGAAAAAESVAPEGGGGRAAGAKAVAALKEALKYKGTPYLWGGSTPETGFDCSGLVQWAYAKQGIEIPRVTHEQILAKNGTEVARKDLVPGDLVFFRDPSGYVYHVGISMGGDKFLHAPRTGDVVKEASLKEPYYAGRFTGARRFDDSPAGTPAAKPEPAAVEQAGAALARDAAAVRSPDTLIFKALSKQEAIQHSSTVQFMRAVSPEEAAPVQRAAAAGADIAPTTVSGSLEYPGDDAGKEKLAAWLAAHAQKAGLPPELPVMAALVESGVANLNHGHADSVGFFQMRVGIWNKGEYAGYPEKPELQAKWFIDHALALKKARIAGGDADFGKDPSSWGNWIADVERPAEQYRGRYQERLEEARGLLRRAS